ncbi:MAG: SDR family oxidoreductase [Candidatus Ancaeobacter aquaticus]|nr:SDR family oxidoreductase [Candidatus Ancaeobacter aquaticus]
MSRYLVTGGAGFIGSNIVKELVSRGEKVTVIDDLSTGNIANITPYLDQIEFVEGSITNLDLLKKLLKDVDYVLHQAAIPSVARSVEDPIRSNEANVTGTLTLLTAVRDAKIKSFVYASSSSVYGNTKQLPKNEDMNPQPLSPYAVSKLTGEYYVRVFASLYNINAISLRYFNVFGPHQNPQSQYAAVIPKFITGMLRGERPVIYGDGEQSRDFTFIDNVVHANILAATKLQNGAGRIMNIACGARYTLNTLVEYLNEILNTELSPEHTESAPGDVKHSQADISRAREYVGYTPQVSLKDGLEKTALWYKEYKGNE